MCLPIGKKSQNYLMPIDRDRRLFFIVPLRRENNFQKSPSNGWQAKVSQKRFATMASRFKKVDDEFIEEFLRELSENELKQKEEHSVLEDVLKKWAAERNVTINLELELLSLSLLLTLSNTKTATLFKYFKYFNYTRR